MGLDIAFNKWCADDAGIETTTFLNSNNDQVVDELIHRLINGCFTYGDDYFDWMLDITICIRAPGMDHWVAQDGLGDVDYIVRANKWGITYYPLTTWLEQEGISWVEI